MSAILATESAAPVMEVDVTFFSISVLRILLTSSSITFLTFTIGLFISSILILGFTALILGFATSFLLGGGCGLVVDVLVPTSSVVDICIHVVCFGGVTKVKAHDGTSEQAIKVSMTVLLFFILEIG